MRILLVACLALGSVYGAACRSTEPELAASTLHLRVTGMTCPVGCPARVRAALASVAGVESAQVDYERRTATVVGRGALDPVALIAALEKQGFGGAVE